ncbi:hypothetical protein [Neptunomonas antarctica]|uniref:Uncharacterized protein n=1 Tax=Neptunomonas antarctica TaxID=619304 RepID=A0A1N7NDY3_9GAMM|nr:hypothetical protein [Neptunomonas antarctica]SIS96577.1 hypothetical protein SAMN05421760_10946 [Neptunomonas antarctica]
MSQQMSVLLQVSLLKCGVAIDRTSLGFTLLSIVMSFLQRSLLINTFQMIAFGIIVLVGIMQKYYAIRVSIDAEIFAQLVPLITARREVKAGEIESELQDLDSAMLHLGLIKANEGTRSLRDRCQGAFRLFKGQVACLSIQGVLLLGILLVNVFSV